MKKLTALVLVTVLSTFSVSAMACPKGTSLSGGVGMHHQGGKCISNGLLKKQALEAKKASMAHNSKTKVVHKNTKKVSLKKVTPSKQLTSVKPTTTKTSLTPATIPAQNPVNPKL